MKRALVERRGLPRRGRAPSGWLALSLLGSCLCAAGCGDIGDVQVPFPVHDTRSRELPTYERLSPPAQAVVGVTVTAAPGGACPFDFEASLPDASAARTLSVGAGSRSVDGEGAAIECLVRPLGNGAFEIHLDVRHVRLGALLATGELGLKPGVLALHLDTPDGASIAATCRVQADELLDGAVWFHSIDCQMRASETEAGSCDVSVRAIFENCWH